MKTYLLIGLMFIFTSVFAQGQTFSVNYKQMPLSEVLLQTEQHFEVRFSYLDELVKDKKFTYKNSSVSLDSLLQIIQEQFQLVFQKIDDRYYIILSEKLPSWQQQSIKEVVINAYLTQGISKKKDGSYQFNIDKIGILPGIPGVDVLETIQQLPGVLSINETATNFSVRGGDAGQNRVIFDGINIYQRGHLFGMVSAFNPYLVQKLKFYYKGTDAQYEGGNSGVLALSSRQKIAKNYMLNMGVNGLSADAVIAIPIIKNKMSLLVSGRSSYRNLFETPTSKSYEHQVFQNTNITSGQSEIEGFSFNDFSSKINYKPNKNNYFSASFLHINQSLNFNNTIDGNDHLYLNDLQTYTNGFSLLSANSINKYKLTTQFGISWYDMAYKNTTQRNQAVIGTIDKENFVSDTYIRTVLTQKNKTRNRWTIGYLYSEKRSAYLFKLVINKKTYVYDYERSVSNSHALFAKYIYRNRKLFDANAGIRVNYLQELNRLYFEPRIVLIKNILPYLKLQITGEIKHQNIQQYNKTVIGLLNLNNNIWQVANGSNFPVMGEKQITAGLLFHKNNWSAEIDLYNKYLENITISVPYRVYNQDLYHIGSATIKGIDLFAKRKFKNLNFSAGYTVGSVLNKFSKLKNNKPFASKLDIQHRLNFIANYNLKGLNVSAGWRWHSKKPYYKNVYINDAEQSGINNNFDIDYLNDYSRFDVSVLYKTSINKHSNIKFGMAIRNILNSKSILDSEQNSYYLNTSLTDFNKYTLGRTYDFTIRYYFN